MTSSARQPATSGMRFCCTEATPPQNFRLDRDLARALGCWAVATACCPPPRLGRRPTRGLARVAEREGGVAHAHEPCASHASTSHCDSFMMRSTLLSRRKSMRSQLSIIVRRCCARDGVGGGTADASALAARREARAADCARRARAHLARDGPVGDGHGTTNDGDDRRDHHERHARLERHDEQARELEPLELKTTMAERRW